MPYKSMFNYYKRIENYEDIRIISLSGRQFPNILYGYILYHKLVRTSKVSLTLDNLWSKLLCSKHHFKKMCIPSTWILKISWIGIQIWNLNLKSWFFEILQKFVSFNRIWTFLDCIYICCLYFKRVFGIILPTKRDRNGHFAKAIFPIFKFL